MCPGSVRQIIGSLETSPRFRTLYDTPDAKVFVLVR